MPPRCTLAIVGLVGLVALAGCPALQALPQRPGEPTPVEPTPVEPRPTPATPQVSWARVATPEDVPAEAPPPGEWRIHLIDVGTGLAILIQGPDFTLLYDAGSNDAAEKPTRVLAYLGAALGSSGDDLCVAAGEPAPTQRRRIDHVVLSHPHLDHASALDLVLHCYDVGHVWDAGAVNQAVFYRDFLEAVAREPGVTYHTAAPVPDDRTIAVEGFAVTMPSAVTWQTFSEGDVTELGAGARFTLLHAESKRHRDLNRSSVVLAVELGATRLLLTGDAASGKRADPSARLGGVEAHLVDHFAAEIDADILQVGHHGSKTSSRRGFLDAVSPSLALVSAGPRTYAGTTLPDPEVIAALEAVGATVLRTDWHDDACPAERRLGAATGPGGCDSYIVTISDGAAAARRPAAPPRSSAGWPVASATPR